MGTKISIVGQKPFFDVYVCDKSYNSENWFDIHKNIFNLKKHE